MKHSESLARLVQELHHLRSSSNIVQALFDSADCGVAIIGPDFTLIESNPLMNSWFGSSRNAEQPHPCHSCLYSCMSAPCPACPGIACLHSGVVQKAMIAVPDGPRGPRRFMVSCIPLKGADGTLLGILEIARHMCLEHEPAQFCDPYEAHPMLVIENAGDAILTFNEHGIIVQVNRAACDISGYGAAELLGMPAAVLVPADVRERLRSARQGLLHTESSPSRTVIEGRLLRSDGSSIPVEETVSIHHHTRGALITSIIRDISAHKNREQGLRYETAELTRVIENNARLLRSTEERYRALVDSANDAILSTDSNGVILSCNRRAAALYEHSAEELIGRHITDFMPADVWGQASVVALPASEDAGSRVVESETLCRDGTCVPLEITISVFESSEHRQVAFIIRDISRHKALEQRLQEHSALLEERVRERTEELQENRNRLIRSEKLAAVGQMSSTVAHGLRNPLVSIGGFARRLLKKEPEGSDSTKYLQIMVDEIDRMETILCELLDFVRPRCLVLSMFSINNLLESALHGCMREFTKRNIQLEKKFHPELPDIEIDADQLNRVLTHLFNNAMEAMPQGGTLSVRTSQDGAMIKIAIADSGAGIASEDIEKIFHPFFTSKPSGSGLGLAVCNQIISIHGGHIKLRRQLPRGTAFDIFLPIGPHDGQAAC